MEALFLGPGTRTGMAILYETPQEVGADRVADAVAAYEKYGGPSIVVDLGTAITFDCISAKGEYVGGVIMPGIGIAAEALFQRTAKLPRVEIREPDRVIGTNTINSIQSGLFYGAVDAMDGMLDRLGAVLGKPIKVIATGGQAPLVAGASKYKPTLDSSLTLDGLRIIYHRIHSSPRRKIGPRPWKTTSTTSPKSKNSSASAARSPFCSRRSIGRWWNPGKSRAFRWQRYLAGIERSFEKFKAGKRSYRKVNTLAYCSQEVFRAVEERALGRKAELPRRPRLEQKRRVSGGRDFAIFLTLRGGRGKREQAGAGRRQASIGGRTRGGLRRLQQYASQALGWGYV